MDFVDRAPLLYRQIHLISQSKLLQQNTHVKIKDKKGPQFILIVFTNKLYRYLNVQYKCNIIYLKKNPLASPVLN